MFREDSPLSSLFRSVCIGLFIFVSHSSYGQRGPNCVSCSAGFRANQDVVDCYSSCQVEGAQLTTPYTTLESVVTQSFSNVCTSNDPQSAASYGATVSVRNVSKCMRASCGYNSVGGSYCSPSGKLAYFGSYSAVTSLKKVVRKEFQNTIDENINCSQTTLEGPYVQSFNPGNDGFIDLEFTGALLGSPLDLAIYDFARQGSTIFAATESGLIRFDTSNVNEASGINISPSGSNATSGFNANANTVGQDGRKAVHGVAIAGGRVWVATLGQGIRSSQDNGQTFNQTFIRGAGLDTNYAFSAESFDDGVAAFGTRRGAYFVGGAFTNGSYSQLRNVSSDDGLPTNAINSFAKETHSGGERYWIAGSKEIVNGVGSIGVQSLLAYVRVENGAIPSAFPVITVPINVTQYVNANGQLRDLNTNPIPSPTNFELNAIYGLAVFPMAEGGSEILVAGLRTVLPVAGFLFRSIDSGLTWTAYELMDSNQQPVRVNKIFKQTNGDLLLGTQSGIRSLEFTQVGGSSPYLRADYPLVAGEENNRKVFDLIQVNLSSSDNRVLLGTSGSP
jgi:hypothetical protein